MAMRFFLENDRPRRKENRALARSNFKPFHHQLDHWFDNFFDDFGDFPFSMSKRRRETEFIPNIDVRENDKNIKIHAELPGMNEKDISVSLKENVLTIKGEKKHETEETSDKFHRLERSYGSFERTIRLPGEVDTDHVKAKYKHGVLSVTLPKIGKAEDKGHTIEVQGS